MSLICGGVLALFLQFNARRTAYLIHGGRHDCRVCIRVVVGFLTIDCAGGTVQKVESRFNVRESTST